MHKSDYESYWKSKKPEDGYYSEYGQNGWTAKPQPRNSFPINWGMIFLAGVFFAMFVILIVVGGMGEHTLTVVNFLLGK